MKALVTGASSGIGKAIYEHLKNRYPDTWEVIGVSRRGPDIKLDLFFTPYSRWPVIPDDLDVLVINHGMLEFDEEAEASHLFRVNLLSYKELLDKNLVKDGGCIILNASVAGIQGAEDVPLYAALKAGVINLTKSYAKKLMSRGIRVNCISPGFFKTNLVPGDLPDELLQTIPMKREADPKELLPVIDALIDCSYITGQNIVVDGGLSL